MRPTKIVTIALLAWALPVAAQNLGEGHSALEACARAAEAKDAATAKAEADRAETLFRHAIDALPEADDPRVEIDDLPARITGADTPLGPVDAALSDLPFKEARERATRAFERSGCTVSRSRRSWGVSTSRPDGPHVGR